MSIPDELALREERLKKIAEARAKIEARAAERHQREQAEHDAKLAARAAKEKATGKKPGGRPPQPPSAGPSPKDQINLTDEESRIMPVPGGGFDQCYNAQAAVAVDSNLVVAIDVTQAPNDKQQVEPMLDKLGALEGGVGACETLLADTGYFSEDNVNACEKAGVEPIIAMGRQPHHPPLNERFAEPPPAPREPTPVEANAHRLKTPEGRKLYALRKQTPEPVFGIIKSVMGFRQFSLRGLAAVRGEWSLVPCPGTSSECSCWPPPEKAERRSDAAHQQVGGTKIGVEMHCCPSRATRERRGGVTKNRSQEAAQMLSPTGC